MGERFTILIIDNMAYNITRVVYFFYYEGKIILTNGFVKNTQKTPPEEIRLAKERRADYHRKEGMNMKTLNEML